MELPEDLKDLLEKLAENAHDIWATIRMEQGWIWGPVRSDSRKEHPNLVAYSELPEQEKELDRNTVIETVKAILALGYRIHRNR